MNTLLLNTVLSFAWVRFTAYICIFFFVAKWNFRHFNAIVKEVVKNKTTLTRDPILQQKASLWLLGGAWLFSWSIKMLAFAFFVLDLIDYF